MVIIFENLTHFLLRCNRGHQKHHPVPGSTALRTLRQSSGREKLTHALPGRDLSGRPRCARSSQTGTGHVRRDHAADRAVHRSQRVGGPGNSHRVDLCCAQFRADFGDGAFLCCMFEAVINTGNI